MDPHSTRGSADHSSAGPSESNPLRVLLADDDPMVQRVLIRALERRGHLVHAAADAATAIGFLGASRFDVALVDANMPGGGLSVLRQLEQRADFTGRAILMSGDLVSQHPSPGSDVLRLEKPFTFPEMMAMVEGRSPD